VLGLPLSHFDDLTPREFECLTTGYEKRKVAEEEAQLWHTRFIATHALNSHPHLKKFLKPQDVLPLKMDKEYRRAKPPTKEEVLAILNKAKQRKNHGKKSG
jgi:hypothetical protein